MAVAPEDGLPRLGTASAGPPDPDPYPGPPGPGTAGLRLCPDPGLRSLDGGTVLLGGYPYRMLRLGPAGARHVARWWTGEPVADSPGAQTLARRLLETGMAQPVPSGGPGPDDVTVVIPVRDRTAELALCLRGLRAHRLAPRVLVVDDGSEDPDAVAAVAADAGADCLHRPVNGGPAAARNTGLAAVGTPVVAFLDSDCVPAPGWLDGLLPHFGDPVVAAVAPRIVPYEPGGPTGQGQLAQNRPALSWIAQYEGVSSTLDMGAVSSIVRPGAKVSYVPGAALMLRTAAARDAGGFAEHMAVGEDVDLVWRLADRGWHIRYEAAATVAHQHRVRLGSWFVRRMDYGTSAAPLERRHPGTLPAVTMSGWTAAAWAATAIGSAAGRPVLGPVAGAGITAAATALLARRLAPVTGGQTWPVATRLAAGGTVAAGRLLGSALSRAWWPVALPAAVAVPRLRLPLAALVLAPAMLGWAERRPPMDPVRYVGARLLDDMAYSLGVWQGCLRHRTARPLLPRLTWRAPAQKLKGTAAPARSAVSSGGSRAPAGRRSRPAPAGPGSRPGRR
ncbi:MAG TPA: mycofactocin biosynthesis glycosyltransferase MftF [Streptosporangiaceae bacterium]|nr:mycofactocin biosynthesis glycosyltransferase MftF [Streptosporangiaceae bacterium]